MKLISLAVLAPYVLGAIDCGSRHEDPPDWCGNGVQEMGEECDDGPNNSDTEPDACRLTCRRPRCGDGVVDPGAGEVCDDGLLQGQGPCWHDCTGIPVCGDGELLGAEECDDGSANSDTLPNACRTDCTLPSCGDGVSDPDYFETCDDGNLQSGDGCSEECLSERCGDGVLQAGEPCDDGNLRSHDGCSSICCVEHPEWLQAGQGPAARIEHAAAYDPVRRRTVVYGGTFGTSSWYLRNLSEYDGFGEWTRFDPATLPAAETGATLAFFPPRGTLVLFGGQGANLLRQDETWEIDGASFTRLAVTESPSAREGAAMTWDASSQTLRLFGGRNTSGLLSDTWEFDGAGWTEVLAASAPSPRWQASLVQHRVTGELLLYGGRDTTGSLSDLWVWGGAGWVFKEEIPVGSTETDRRLAWLPGFEELVVVDGGEADGVATVWRRAGASWAQVPAAQEPDARLGFLVVPHAFPPQLLIVGGRIPEGEGYFGYSEGLTRVCYWPDEWWPLPDELCGNGIDDDHDGLVDCADPDCDLAPTC